MELIRSTFNCRANTVHFTFSSISTISLSCGPIYGRDNSEYFPLSVDKVAMPAASYRELECPLVRGEKHDEYL